MSTISWIANTRVKTKVKFLIDFYSCLSLIKSPFKNLLAHKNKSKVKFIKK